MAKPAAATLRLYDIAHGRTGDKGNRLNISLFPYDPAHWDWLAEVVTPERVRAHFALRSPSSVKRYDLPAISGFNFVLEDALGGGVNSSLYLDTHGKCLSFHLLAMTIPAPETKNGR